MIFPNRFEAGKKLASKLLTTLDLTPNSSLVVLAIPRGGVIIGSQLSSVLKCPLEVIMTKKIGAPGNPELAIGAVGPIGEPVIDETLAARLGADENYLKSKILNLKSELANRFREYRGDKPTLDLKNKVVVITDDGVATGSTMKAAIEIIRQESPQKIIVAVPVIAKDTLKEIENLADEVIYLKAPDLFFAVGQFYQDFKQVTDEEVKELLK
ncbi:phosphoribosyl transferase [Candidatus Woesebacteria bacterium CG_4_10_14_0_2_um_filter_39_14]|uniref:Phosphoribosyl transferase n=3 Tax=Microgenomates group TaxID=1794810 RepID=A0A2M6YPX9_9BACT|nr:MAG: phosphoribosyl transferase [Candidatus Shapirobacteria bacterium CG07_land_8_20_14_0_80_39_12]PIZ50081.1 MAG: phosphoribosyl transferase [Candidatus Woesebacteria bacterium CG_4_10_14_0_2_um_filter_39_14]PJA49394.1 MAG: phosphoribosyl transferase [Candidatus Shapirobacteria bacterium CG_4_9_14_3_um_filter_39_13]